MFGFSAAARLGELSEFVSSSEAFYNFVEVMLGVVFFPSLCLSLSLFVLLHSQRPEPSEWHERNATNRANGWSVPQQQQKNPPLSYVPRLGDILRERAWCFGDGQVWLALLVFRFLCALFFVVCVICHLLFD